MQRRWNDWRPTSPLVLSRRRVLGTAIGAAGAAAIAGVGRGGGLVVAQNVAPELSEPEVFTSQNGLLETTLVAQPQTYEGLGTKNYGGRVPGPTLRVRAGDTLKIKLVNRLSEDAMDETAQTNLHVHGLHVSPLGHGDNVFVHVMPGDEWDFEYQIPESHPAGLFWYHPHRHMHVGEQVGGGMAGAIIIEGDLDELSQTKAARERLLVLQGPFVPGNTSGYVINGLVNPTIRIRQGEWQRWRILNATAETFFNLHLDGHTLHRVSVDGNYLRDVAGTDDLLLGPAERAEVLIQGGPPTENGYVLRSLAWEGLQGEFPLARLIAEGGTEEAGAEATALPTALTPVPDLRDAAVVARREITFRRGFKISHAADDPVGVVFDPDRVDESVDLGATEEWVLRNDTVAWHPFHIHVNDFQVISSNGQAQLEPFVYYKDTIPLPPKVGDVPGEVVVRIPFLDFTGRFVYHCHILPHEDGGMMGVVEVVQPVGIGENAFDAAEVEVVAGTTVRWRNESKTAHTVTADDGTFDSGNLDPGATFSHTFEAVGTVAYHCEVHAAMQATVVVK